MPSTAKIKKEEIVQAAFDLLAEKGNDEVNIKAVARKLGCSTQPISWQFGGMDGLRKELTRTAEMYVGDKLRRIYESCDIICMRFWTGYVDIAIDEPHIFRYVCMGESRRKEKDGMNTWRSIGYHQKIWQELQTYLPLEQAQADFVTQSMTIYIQGAASLLASEMITETRDTVHRMIYQEALALLQFCGIKEQAAEKFLSV